VTLKPVPHLDNLPDFLTIPETAGVRTALAAVTKERDRLLRPSR